MEVRELTQFYCYLCAVVFVLRPMKGPTAAGIEVVVVNNMPSSSARDESEAEGEEEERLLCDRLTGRRREADGVEER